MHARKTSRRARPPAFRLRRGTDQMTVPAVPAFAGTQEAERWAPDGRGVLHEVQLVGHQLHRRAAPVGVHRDESCPVAGQEFVAFPHLHVLVGRPALTEAHASVGAGPPNVEPLPCFQAERLVEGVDLIHGQRLSSLHAPPDVDTEQAREATSADQDEEGQEHQTDPPQDERPRLGLAGGQPGQDVPPDHRDHRQHEQPGEDGRTPDGVLQHHLHAVLLLELDGLADHVLVGGVVPFQHEGLTALAGPQGLGEQTRPAGPEVPLGVEGWFPDLGVARGVVVRHVHLVREHIVDHRLRRIRGRHDQSPGHQERHHRGKELLPKGLAEGLGREAAPHEQDHDDDVAHDHPDYAVGRVNRVAPGHPGLEHEPTEGRSQEDPEDDSQRLGQPRRGILTIELVRRLCCDGRRQHEGDEPQDEQDAESAHQGRVEEHSHDVGSQAAHQGQGDHHQSDPGRGSGDGDQGKESTPHDEPPQS